MRENADSANDRERPENPCKWVELQWQNRTTENSGAPGSSVGVASHPGKTGVRPLYLADAMNLRGALRQPPV
jgi:hypothetical protein